jgi:hypothetical protein
MKLKVVAVADNANATAMCMDISWDGEWRDEKKEMVEHFCINKEPCRS